MDKEYRAYLIRLTRKSEWAHWRVTLEDGQGGIVQHFASENELLRYLAKQLRGVSPLSDSQPESKRR